jgi:hypothetical protein
MDGIDARLAEAALGGNAAMGFIEGAVMPRPPRIDFPDAIYHVTSRGNGRAAIFWSDTDRERFLLKNYRWSS